MIAAFETATFVLYLVAAAMLVVAAVLTLTRMERGPRILDRIVSLDVFTAILVGCVALISAALDRDDLVPVMLALALTGFFGSVAMARFSTTDKAGEKRILTEEEMRRELEAREQEQEDDDAPALFDPEEEDEDEELDELQRSTSARGELHRRAERGPSQTHGAHGEGHGNDPLGSEGKEV